MAIAQFARIGQVKFLDNRIPPLPYYKPFLGMLQAGGRLVDVGCGLGQELRYFAFNDKIDSSQLCDIELNQRLIDLGYELFRDRETFKANISAGDILAPLESQPHLTNLKGKADMLQVSMVLHMFDWSQMVEAAKTLVALSSPKPGTLIAGSQMGSRNAGSYAMPSSTFNTSSAYRHNKESMERFWKQIGDETGSSWTVEQCIEVPARAVKENKDAWWAKEDPGLCMICFCARRL